MNHILLLEDDLSLVTGLAADFWHCHGRAEHLSITIMKQKKRRSSSNILIHCLDNRLLLFYPFDLSFEILHFVLRKICSTIRIFEIIQPLPVLLLVDRNDVSTALTHNSTLFQMTEHQYIKQCNLKHLPAQRLICIMSAVAAHSMSYQTFSFKFLTISVYDYHTCLYLTIFILLCSPDCI